MLQNSYYLVSNWRERYPKCWKVASWSARSLPRLSNPKGWVYLSRVHIIQNHIHSTNMFWHLPCTRYHVKWLFSKALIDFPSTWNSLRVLPCSESPCILDGCTMGNEQGFGWEEVDRPHTRPLLKNWWCLDINCASQECGQQMEAVVNGTFLLQTWRLPQEA